MDAEDATPTGGRMTSIDKLIRHWEESAGGRLTAEEYRVRLPMWDAARLLALAEMYPRRTLEELIADLLSAALDELGSAMPYMPGKLVVTEDEEGDPVYQDVGPTPRFLELSWEHMRALENASQARGGEPMADDK